MQSYFRHILENLDEKKFRFVYLWKTWFKFYQSPDPDPHSSKMLDPNPLISNTDPKHCRHQTGVV
jgi:hypothetical protein